MTRTYKIMNCISLVLLVIGIIALIGNMVFSTVILDWIAPNHVFEAFKFGTIWYYASVATCVISGIIELIAEIGNHFTKR